MNPQDIVLLVEQLSGHFFIGLIGLFIMLGVKDYMMDVLKSWKIRRSMQLSIGDQVLISGEQAVVVSRNLVSYTFLIIKWYSKNESSQHR